MASKSLPAMQFIVSSNYDKVDPVTRRLIRSHVMRGKKQKKPRRQTVIHGPPAAPIELEYAVETCAAAIPGRVGSDLSFVEFADQVEPSLLLKMIKVSPVAMQVVFPLMAAIGFQPDPRGSLYPLVYDAATLHITAFAIDGFFGRVLGGHGTGLSSVAMMHLRKGLRLLSERLLEKDDEKKISDSTIGIVLKLAVTAHFDGEWETSRQHMEGLRKIVDLRGGLKVFDGTKLAVEIMRCDLTFAVLHESRPKFFPQPSEPMADYPTKLMLDSNLQKTDELTQKLDPDLAIAWKVMGRFCLLVNLGAQTSRLIEPELIHQTMAAVVYRLLHMRFSFGSLDESLRLGLLVFSYHTFLQWQDIRFSLQLFPVNYKRFIQELESADKTPSRVMLWLLVTAASSFFNVADEAWLATSLREYAGRYNIATWKHMEEELKSIMWIPLLDGKAGKELMDLLQLNDQKIGARKGFCGNDTFA